MNRSKIKFQRQHKILIVFSFLIIILLASCLAPHETKTIHWKNYSITLESYRGGATVSDFWKIKASNHSWPRNRLIFKSYSYPAISDIQLWGDHLLIVYANRELGNSVIPLADLKKYMNHPVEYRKGKLEKTNPLFADPLKRNALSHPTKNRILK